MPQMTQMKPQTANKAPKFWNIVTDETQDHATITFYGDVVETHPTDFWTGEKLDGLFICQDEFLNDLETIKNKKKITIKLNSGGGDLFTGVAIHNALKGLPAEKNVIIEGLAASAASVIACAGDTVAMYPSSVYMVHSPAVFIYDSINTNSLNGIQTMLETCERAIAEIYAAKTGLSLEECHELIAAETWLTGKQALEKGFADTIVDGSVQVTASNKYLFVNGVKKLNLSSFSMPEALNVPKAAESFDIEKEQENEKEQETMSNIENLEQLRAAFPALCDELENQVKSQALNAERKRLKDIEKIENIIGDKALIDSAKYGDQPLDAKDLAFIAMQKQAEIGAAMQNAIKNDAKESGAEDVEANAPESAEAENKRAEEESLARVVDAAKKLR